MIFSVFQTLFSISSCVWLGSNASNDLQTQLGRPRPGPTEIYATFDPDYLKRAAEISDNLVRAVRVWLPEKEVCSFRRKGKDIQRGGWWAL